MAATSGRSDLAIDDTSESGRADLTLDADTVDPTAPPAMVLCAFEGADADAATCSSSPAPGMLRYVSSMFSAGASTPSMPVEEFESEAGARVESGPEAGGEPYGGARLPPMRRPSRQYAGESTTSSMTPASILRSFGGASAANLSDAESGADAHAHRPATLTQGESQDIDLEQRSRALKSALSSYLHQKKLYPHWFTNRGKRFMYFLGVVIGLAIAMLGERFWGARVRLPASPFIGGVFALLFALATKLHVFSACKSPVAKLSKGKRGSESTRRSQRTHFYMSPRGAAHQKAAAAKKWLELRPLTQSDEHKDWFRLMYKMTCDAMSARDVTRLSVDQLTFLIPFVLTLPGTLGLAELKVRCSTRVSEDGHVTRRMRWRTYAWGRTHAESLVGHESGWLERLAEREPPRAAWLRELADEFEPARKWFEKLITTKTLQKGQRFALARDLGAGFFDPLAAPFDATLAAPVTHVFVQRTFDSGHGPSVLELRGADEKVLAELMIKPDDVRRDALVLDLFTLFNYLWRHSFIPDHLNPVAMSFAVLPGGTEWGFLEVRGPAHPLSPGDET